MIKRFKHTPEVWWGFETLEAECNCDLDNNEIRNKQIFKSERERDKALDKWFEETTKCVKQYKKFCTNININKNDNKVEDNNDIINY